jgi:transcriptional regulator with XRE-family HTH domain
MEAGRQVSKEEREGYLYEKIVVNFTETMLELLEQKGMNRSDFASKLEVSPAYITKLLNGVNVSVRQMAKIAVALDQDIEIKMKSLDDLAYGTPGLFESVFEANGNTTIETANTNEYALAA